MMREYILLGILVLLFGCIQPGPVENVTNASDINMTVTPNQSVTPAENATVPEVTEPESTEPQTYRHLEPGETLDIGDIALVDYTLFVNGTVYDTSNATLANESGIYNPSRTYEPFSYDVEFNQGVIDGFIIGTIGMKINETLLFHADPDRGYGPYDPNKVVVVPRYYNKSNYETVPRSFVEEQDPTQNITNGTAYQTPYGDVFIDHFDNETVTLFYLMMVGHEFILNGIPQKVVATDTENFTATIEFMLNENETYVLPNPQTGSSALYTVIGKTDQNITLDGNHPLANETLTFEVTLLDAVRPS